MGVRSTQRGWQSYAGQSNRLIIGVDIGTTFSGAAYCVLKAGEKPKIIDVCNFPNQKGGGQYKTPSSVLYAADGSVLAIGSETDDERVRHLASVSGASEAKWWKMGLGSQSTFNHHFSWDEEQAEALKQKVLLPPNKSAEDVYTDYLAWIVAHVEKYIAAFHQNGAALVKETKANRLLILTHPNGWSGAQQNALRRACIKARVISDANRVATLIKFVSEAEASLTYSLMCQTMAAWTQPGSHVAIVDAGGGTIDMTSYRIESIEPFITAREVSVSQCMFEGSTSVDVRAKMFLKMKLSGTRWDNEDDLEYVLQEFIKSTKFAFSNPRTPCLLRIGTMVDTDERIGLQKGMLVISGSEVAELFRGSIEATVKGLKSIFASYPPHVPKRVAFVGGFSENTYLRESVAKAFGSNVQVAKPDNSTAKAVANGAVAWAIDGVVTARVAKMWYGVRCAVPLNRRNKEHSSRLHTKIEGADGQARLPNAFHILHAKGDAVTEETEIKAQFAMTKDVTQEFHGAFDLLVYRGDEHPPEFIDDDQEQGFETLCTLEVNLDRLQNALPTRMIKGKRFKSVCFEIHITLYETEMTARWVWNEQAISHSGEAETIYLDDLEFFTRKAALPARRESIGMSKEANEEPQMDPEANSKQGTPHVDGKAQLVECNDDVSSISGIRASTLADDITDEQISVLIRALELKRAQKTKSALPVPPTTELKTQKEQVDEERTMSSPDPRSPLAEAAQNVPVYRPSTLLRNVSVSSSSTVSTSPQLSSTARRAPPPVPTRAGRNAAPSMVQSAEASRPNQSAKAVEAASELEQLGFTGAFREQQTTQFDHQSQTYCLAEAGMSNPPPPYNEFYGAEAESER